MALSDLEVMKAWESILASHKSLGERIFGFARAIEAEARRDALEEAAKRSEAMHEEDRPGDYAYAIRALKEAKP